jgi:hypothetical protein
VGAVYHYAGRQALYAVLVLGGAMIGALHNGVPGVAWAVVIAVALNYISMTRLSTRLVAVSLGQVLQAHLVGIWASLWVAVALVGSIDTVRAHSEYEVLVLIESVAIAVLAWLAGVAVAALLVPFGCLPGFMKLLSVLPNRITPHR